MFSDEFFDQSNEMFSDTEDESSSSTSDEEEDPSEGGSHAEQEWTAEGSLQTFPFSGAAQFNIGAAESAFDFFNLIFNSKLITMLVTSVNNEMLRLTLEDKRKRKRNINQNYTNDEEMRVFIALFIHMGHIRLDRLTDYWSTEPLLDLPFKNFLTQKRFLMILRNLTFSDDNSYSNTDPNRYVKPILHFFNAVMKNLASPSKNLTINECVVDRKDRLKTRVIETEKPKPGVKLYALSDTKGITHRLNMYRKSQDAELKVKGHTDYLVMTLVEDYLDKGHSLYTKNWFKSVTLAEKLLQRRTNITGTLKSKRFRNPTISASLDKGTCLSSYNLSGVCITKYKEKRNTVMLSTVHHSDFVESRHDRHDQIKPLVVEYEKHIKGIDRKDRMLSLYPCYIKTIKWYKKIILHVMEVMLLNSYKIYKQHVKQSNPSNVMSFLDFRLNVIKKLLKLDKQQD